MIATTLQPPFFGGQQYLAQLSLPAPCRRGLEGIVNKLLSTADAIWHTASCVFYGSVRIMLDPAVALWAVPSIGHSYVQRRLRMVRQIRLFGTAFSTPLMHSPIQFTLRALARACRPPHAMDVFPTPDVVAHLICCPEGDWGRGDDVEAAGAGGRAVDAAARDYGASAGDEGVADDEAAADDEATADEEAGAADGWAAHGRAADERAADDAADDEGVVEEKAAADDRAGAADGWASDGAADDDRVVDDEAAADEAAFDEICARFIDPLLLTRQLGNVRLRLAPGCSWLERLRWSWSSQPLLFGHGTTVEAAVLARRWGVHDPHLLSWMRLGIPPGCCAFYYVPILNETSILPCASFALEKHTTQDADGRLVERSEVEVLLFRAPERVYDPAYTMAGRHVFGGPHPTRELIPVLVVLSLLQLRVGRFVNWMTMCRMQVVRLLSVHPVAEETGLAGAMLGEVTDGACNVSNVYHPDGRSKMEGVGSITFDVLPAEE